MRVRGMNNPFMSSTLYLALLVLVHNAEVCAQSKYVFKDALPEADNLISLFSAQGRNLVPSLPSSVPKYYLPQSSQTQYESDRGPTRLGPRPQSPAPPPPPGYLKQDPYAQRVEFPPGATQYQAVPLQYPIHFQYPQVQTRPFASEKPAYATTPLPLRYRSDVPPPPVSYRTDSPPPPPFYVTPAPTSHPYDSARRQAYNSRQPVDFLFNTANAPDLGGEHGREAVRGINQPQWRRSWTNGDEAYNAPLARDIQYSAQQPPQYSSPIHVLEKRDQFRSTGDDNVPYRPTAAINWDNSLAKFKLNPQQRSRFFEGNAKAPSPPPPNTAEVEWGYPEIKNNAPQTRDWPKPLPSVSPSAPNDSEEQEEPEPKSHSVSLPVPQGKSPSPPPPESPEVEWGHPQIQNSPPQTRGSPSITHKSPDRFEFEVALAPSPPLPQSSYDLRGRQPKPFPDLLKYRDLFQGLVYIPLSLLRNLPIAGRQISRDPLRGENLPFGPAPAPPFEGKEFHGVKTHTALQSISDDHIEPYTVRPPRSREVTPPPRWEPTTIAPAPQYHPTSPSPRQSYDEPKDASPPGYAPLAPAPPITPNTSPRAYRLRDVDNSLQEDLSIREELINIDHMKHFAVRPATSNDLGEGDSDEHDLCCFWAQTNECGRNSQFMLTHCKKSCSASGCAGCTDEMNLCGRWAAHGECQNNMQYMKYVCRAACTSCVPLKKKT